MCSLFFVPSTNINNSNNNNNILSNMDQSFQGDLTDILRGSTNSTNINSGYGDQLGLPNISSTDWHFSSDHHHNNSTIGNISTNNFSSLLEDDHQVAILSLPDIDHHHMPFGDPFSNMRDPLLHDNAGPAAAFFGASSDAAASGFFGVPGGPAPAHALLDHHHHQNHQQEAKFRPSCNIFSRMLQINPSSSTASAASAAIGPSSAAAVANKHVSEAAVGPAQCDNSVAAAVGSVIKAGEGIINVGSGSQSAAAAVAENVAGGGGGMQISSPRNPGIKRRYESMTSLNYFV